MSLLSAQKIQTLLSVSSRPLQSIRGRITRTSQPCNHLGSSATLTVEITTEDAKDNVTFVSTSSVTVSGDGTTATVDLNNDNSITLLVDVDSNVSSSVDTVDFVVSGGANDGRVSVDINEQTGPTVNKN